MNAGMARKPPVFSVKPSSDVCGLPVFSWEELTEKEEIGRGSFGAVLTAKRPSGEVVVVKRLLREHDREKRLFLKEARLLNSISSQHIVQLKAVCATPVAMMLEYLFFDFEPFGIKRRVSSLQDFLDFTSTDPEYVVGFSCLHTKIAQDVSFGLKYLHENGIVHRDLKPANVLVSNQHYCDNAAGKEACWTNGNGIACKLVDFGESRSSVHQTATVCQTMTSNVNRGTIVYMAPELLSPEPAKGMSLDDLKKSDVWSLGMVFFMLMNPDLQYPFQSELDKLPERSFEASKKEVIRRLLQQLKPCFSNRFSLLQAKDWQDVDRGFDECTKFSPADRPSAAWVADLFQDKEGSTSLDVPLGASQSTAVEDHDRLVGVGTACPGDVNTDDATNACALLAVGIADKLVEEGRRIGRGKIVFPGVNCG